MCEKVEGGRKEGVDSRVHLSGFYSSSMMTCL